MAAISPETHKQSLKHNKVFIYAAIFSIPLEGLFFFGLIIGWSNLAEILKAEGVYAEVCQNGNLTSCSERDEIFSAVGTLGSITMNFMVFPLGLIFDRYGSFITRWDFLYLSSCNFRSICTALMSIGLLLIMFTVDVNWLMYPGIFFLTSGSFTLLVGVKIFPILALNFLTTLVTVTNHPLSQLIPKATAIIMAFGLCVFQFSNSAFRLWQLLYDAGVPFKAIVAANLSFSLVQWIRTFFLMPLAKGWSITRNSMRSKTILTLFQRTWLPLL